MPPLRLSYLLLELCPHLWHGRNRRVRHPKSRLKNKHLHHRHCHPDEGAAAVVAVVQMRVEQGHLQQLP